MPVEIVELNKSHNRSEFDCGAESLNLYLKVTAHQAQTKAKSKTTVLVHPESPKRILGYFTLVLAVVPSDDFPPPYCNQYKNGLPGVNLARLAVSLECQREGYGALLLVKALEKVLRVSEQAGCASCFVDAKNGAQAFYQKFGFIPLLSDPNRLFLPIKTIKALQR
ncbi:MAG: GNAT family N-acetyltransferase [Kangiella sp.]|nr:MAG: GNAT family N-acetyltransferase [Kangiella sp.]